ncbi:hypothetical protein KFK09_014231 [Dendrobium nobile]|uniref:Uncharacterized protein n=1 Tax=Dendrobium nobile TaxID=94219 RepID=A0A8T3B9I4_DENNO|nr:hypothetical protein KFK09_014231 [Dendrobium nobile]
MRDFLRDFGRLLDGYEDSNRDFSKFRGSVGFEVYLVDALVVKKLLQNFYSYFWAQVSRGAGYLFVSHLRRPLFQVLEVQNTWPLEREECGLPLQM